MKAPGKGPIPGERAARLTRKWTGFICETYLLAARHCWTHRQILARLSEYIYQTSEWSRVPQATREYVNGYAAALRDATWRQMAWLKSVDGQGSELPRAMGTGRLR